MQNATPKGGAVLLGGERSTPTKSTPILQPFDALARHRALVLMQEFGLRAELAAMVAALAFEGGPAA